MSDFARERSARGEAEQFELEKMQARGLNELIHAGWKAMPRLARYRTVEEWCAALDAAELRMWRAALLMLLCWRSRSSAREKDPRQIVVSLR